ncbi:MAG TPA: hypothetical protein VM580_01385, partial [Labilithrix sp.]|nr:hypothetical protein [Labilithrix sp.]
APPGGSSPSAVATPPTAPPVATPAPPTTPTRAPANTATSTARAHSTTTAAPTKKVDGVGTLTVVCIPKCDQIVDNGTSLGPGHIFNRPVPAGRHALVLSANGVKKALVVDVLPDRSKEVRISMDKP